MHPFPVWIKNVLEGLSFKETRLDWRVKIVQKDVFGQGSSAFLKTGFSHERCENREKTCFLHFRVFSPVKKGKKRAFKGTLAPCEDAGFGDAFGKVDLNLAKRSFFQQDIMNISPNLSNLMKANVHIGHHVRRTHPNMKGCLRKVSETARPSLIWTKPLRLAPRTEGDGNHSPEEGKHPLRGPEPRCTADRARLSVKDKPVLHDQMGQWFPDQLVGAARIHGYLLPNPGTRVRCRKVVNDARSNNSVRTMPGCWTCMKSLR